MSEGASELRRFRVWTPEFPWETHPTEPILAVGHKDAARQYVRQLVEDGHDGPEPEIIVQDTATGIERRFRSETTVEIHVHLEALP